MFLTTLDMPLKFSFVGGAGTPVEILEKYFDKAMSRGKVRPLGRVPAGTCPTFKIMKTRREETGCGAVFFRRRESCFLSF